MKPYIKKGQGRPLLLMHSSLSAKVQWLPLLQMLPDHYETMAIDLIGYGQAIKKKAGAPHSLNDEVHWVDQFWKPQEPGLLIGHSFGGAVAMAWALKNPDKVQAIALYEPVLFGLLNKGDPGWQEIEIISNRVAKHLASNDLRASAIDFVDYWSGAGTFERLPVVLQRDFTQSMTKVIQDFQAIDNLDFSLEEIGKAPFDIYLMTGDQSRESAHHVINAIEKRAHQVAVLRIEEAGHMGPITHKDRVNKALLEWLSKYTA